jgi:pimeloyl-ACP methyl ester carboxylesterase
MMRLGFVVALLLAFVHAYAAPDSLSVPVGTSGAHSPTGIWWPKSANSKKSAKVRLASAAKSSVVVWFHGGMGSSNCAKGLVAGTDFANLYPEKIVISVSACRENHWVTETMMNVVDAALDSVAARRKSPVDEVLLVGVSDGALGVILYSIQGKRRVKDRLLVSSFGKILGEASAVAGANASRMRSGRWRFLQGGKDRLYPSDQTVPWITEFCKAVQVDCELRFDPEGEHDWSYWKDKRLDWIREATP